jgi:predicted PurR-regulated permease PerM
VIEENVLHQELALHDILKKETSQLIKNSRLIEKTIFSSTTALFNIFLIVVYTFLFLLYRTSIKNFILMHFHNRNKKEARRILHNIKEVAQNYFLGLLIVMVLLGALNGLGLLWIGIDFPFLFGYTAAILAVIPYIGTFIGAVLPFLYAIMNTDNLWTPVFVIAWYTFVQAIEGNILTPNIVGSKVSMNPLVVIIALLTGNLIWGIAGMILFIPGLAILKVIFDNIAPLKPYALLLSSDFGHDSNAFIDKLGTKIKEKITKN